jgi:Tfp pilus assembly protein PilF
MLPAFRGRKEKPASAIKIRNRISLFLILNCDIPDIGIEVAVPPVLSTGFLLHSIRVNNRENTVKTLFHLAKFLVLAAPLGAAGLPEPLLRLYERISASNGWAQTGSSKPQQDRAVRTQDASDPVWVLLDGAYAALREGDLDAAIAGFEKAVSLSSKRVDIRKDLAYTYLRVGENELARRQFEEVAVLDAADWHSQLELAFLDYDAGTTALKSAAREIFARAARGGDEASRATAQRALAFIDAETDLLLKPFLTAVTLDPTDTNAWFRVATLREQRNEWALAVDAYQRAYLVTSPFASALVGIGRCFLGLNRRDDAVRFLTQAARAADDLYSGEEARELLAKIETERP